MPSSPAWELTLGEIEQGISRIRSRGDNEQAAGLERWLRELELGFADRILPITLPVAAAWGRQQHQPHRVACRIARMPNVTASMAMAMPATSSADGPAGRPCTRTVPM
jgi:hypothetical protein